MALSDERIWEIAEAHTQYDRNTHIVFFAHAIEAEVRKQDDALIQQLVDALKRCTKYDDEDYAALHAGRARLGGKP